MAFLLPANLVNNMEVPAPLRQAAQAFRDWLPEQVTVTLHTDHDPDSDSGDPTVARAAGNSGRPYLVVLHPALGVAFLDFVPGSTARALAASRRSRATIRRLADETRERLGQLSDDARRRLIDHGLDSKRVPIALAIAAPRLTRQKALAAGRTNVGQFLLQDDLSASSIEAALERVLTHANGQRSDTGAALSAIDENRVRAAINPQLVVHRTARVEQGQLVFRPPSGGEDTIQVLDRMQERLAEHLGAGYRVIKGVAGSGKTLVLLFRARHLARHHPRWQILLTCFNRPLASSLTRQLSDCPNVTVRTVDGLASVICGTLGVETDHFGNAKYDRRIEEVKQALDAGRVPEQYRYDAVLIDEAQDLDTSRTRMAFGLLKQPWNDFVVALDSAQNLYRRQPGLPPPAQHPPGSADSTEISGRGRTEVLRDNYRNTYEILSFADGFLRAGGVPEGGDEEDPATFIPPESAERSGPRPDVRPFEQPAKGYEAVFSALRRSHDEDGVLWSDMVILTGNPRILDDIEQLASDRSIPTFKLRDLRTGGHEPSPGVRLSTLQHAKGLEFSRVYIVGVDDIWAGPGTDDMLRRRLLYVGMTRATDVLKIAVSGSGTIVDSLLAVQPV